MPDIIITEYFKTFSFQVRPLMPTVFYNDVHSDYAFLYGGNVLSFLPFFIILQKVSPSMI